MPVHKWDGASPVPQQQIFLLYESGSHSVAGSITSLLLRLITIFLPIKKRSEASQSAAETLALMADILALL